MLGIPLCLHFCDLDFVPGSKEIIFIMTIMCWLKDFVGQSCWKLTALIFRSEGWEERSVFVYWLIWNTFSFKQAVAKKSEFHSLLVKTRHSNKNPLRKTVPPGSPRFLRPPVICGGVLTDHGEGSFSPDCILDPWPKILFSGGRSNRLTH